MRVIVLCSGVTVAELPLADLARVVAVPPAVAAPLTATIQEFTKRLSVPRLFTPNSRYPGSASGLVQRGVFWSAIDEVIPQQGKVVVQQVRVRCTILGSKSAIPGLAVATTHRFSGSAWALMRSDGATSLASAGQLGGSQIGVRLFYTPGPKAYSITARMSAPLSQSSGREAAIGVALRGRNVGVIAEQRISLDKAGSNAPAVFAYGGVSDVMLPGVLKLDGYVEAGVVGMKYPAAFVDSAIHIERTVIKVSSTSLSIGAGAWGGAQPSVSRIDIGPQIVARIAIANTNLRISADWRQRVAGNAAPTSGPSVTVGFDF